MPVILTRPLRGLKAQRCPLDPSCSRHGMDKHQTRPLARGVVPPRPLFCKIPGKLPRMVLVHAGRIEGPLWPLETALWMAGGALLPQRAASGQANLGVFLQR